MICASVNEKRMENVLRKVKNVPKGYDIVEIWINEIKNLDINKLFEWKRRHLRPLLLIKLTDVSNRELVKKILKNHVDLFDIDISDYNKIEDLISEYRKKYKKGTHFIASYHDFKGTPTVKKAKRIAGKMKELGADVGKIVFYAKKCEDNLVPIQLLSELKMDLVSFCMGEKGRISRILAPKFGSKISFIPPNEKWKTAKGQIIFKEWEKIKSIFK